MSKNEELTVEKSFADRQLELQERDLRWHKQRFIIMLSLAALAVGAYFIAAVSLFGPSLPSSKDYVAMVKVEGPIMADSQASALNIDDCIDKAFADKKAKGVVLYINSPGGAPVQAAQINAYLRAKEKQYPKQRVIAVGSDMIASGAYMIAVAAPKIYIDQSTLAGSIGVVSEGFGFNKLLETLGVDRRIYTAGTHKRELDPYMPEKPEDVARERSILERVHKVFINIVRAGRGDRLKGTDEELFNGDVWVGQEAVERGIVDGVGQLDEVLKAQFGTEYWHEYSPKKSFISTLMQTAASMLPISEMTSYLPVLTIYRQ